MSEIVFQGEPTECGLAALATISNILGQPIKIEELRKHDVFTTGGVAMDVLSQLANKYELAHDIVAFTPEDIMDLTCPSILHLKGNHYVVLKKSDKPICTNIKSCYGRADNSFNSLL